MSKCQSLFFVLFFSLFLQEVSAAKNLGNTKALRDGTFQYNLGQQPTTLNPLSSSDYYAGVVQGYIQEQLADRNVDTYDWAPALATKWTVARDQLSFTFHLREGVKWHDGKEFTAEDVKFTFDAIMDKKNRWKTAHQKPYYENISEVKILDKYKVQFMVKTPYFKNFDVCAGLAPVPKHLFKDLSKKNLKKLNKTLVGTGPYVFSKVRRGKYITLKANSKWWGLKNATQKGRFNYKKILMRFVKDGSIAIARTEKGEIDFLNLSDEDFMKKAKGKKWGKSVFKIQATNKSPNGYGFIGWNLRNPKFKSKATRKALSHLLNRDLMIKKFRYGLSIPATGPLYRTSEYADSYVRPIKFDPKKALTMLKKDGWKSDAKDSVLYKMVDGKKIRLSFTIMEPNKEFVKYLTLFKEDAKRAGVDVKIKYIEWNSFIKLLDERKFEAVRLGWGGGSVDWDPKQIWHSQFSKVGSNFVGYENPVVDKLIDQARLIMNKAKRMKILKKVFRIIADDAPYTFFFNTKYVHYAHTKRMKRVKDTYQYGVGLDYWWIKK
jgi:ABC-type transport system substrate-binding protein